MSFDFLLNVIIVVHNRLPESGSESQWQVHVVALPFIVSPVLRTGETTINNNLSEPICPTGEGGCKGNQSHLYRGKRMASELWEDVPLCIVGKPHGAMRWAPVADPVAPNSPFPDPFVLERGT